MSDSTRDLNDSFSGIVKHLLSLLSFEVTKEPEIAKSNRTYRPDFLITQKPVRALCEVKFYRSRIVSTDLILKSALLLGYTGKQLGFECLLIVSSIVPRGVKEQLKDNGITLWDRSNIANFLLSVDRDDLLAELGQLITESQQGIDTSYPYQDIDEDTERDPLRYFSNTLPETAHPLNKGEQLIAELNEIPLGKSGWSAFERKCIETLKYLFDTDLFSLG